MNLNKIKLTMATGMLAASMILPGMTAMADGVTKVTSTTDVIKKTVQSPEGVSYSGKSFSFEFEQDGYTGTGASKTFVGSTDDASVPGGKANLVEAKIPSTTTKTTLGSTKANTKDGVDTETAYADIDLSALTTPGVYTYTVKETLTTTADETTGVDEANGTTWKYDVTTYKLRVYVENGGSGLTKTMTIVKSSEDDDNRDTKKKEKAEFTNLLTKRGGSGDGGDDPEGPKPGTDTPALTIKKTVSDADKKFEPASQTYVYTVTFEENSLNTATDGLNKQNEYEYYVVSNGTRSAAKTIKSGETIQLKSGETAEFYKIYAGTKVTVAESDKDSNNKTINNLANVYAKVTSNGETTDAGTTAITKANSAYTVSDVLIGQGTNSIEYTNDFSDVTVTGVVTNIAPYVTLVVAAVLAVVAYMGLKNRLAR